MASSTGRAVFVVRHGETEWSRAGRHTGLTDIPLTERGRSAARALAPLLARLELAAVLTSPLARARTTCELAGLGDRMQIDDDLVEWAYGEYEGLTPAEIERRNPGWLLFADGCPGGERPAEVATRVDRVIARVRAVGGPVALFAHGHLLRVLAARWIELPAAEATRFLLDTSTLGVLAYYRGIPTVKRWNAPFVEGRTT
jgi:probable phosphoglycerate mutase